MIDKKMITEADLVCVSPDIYEIPRSWSPAMHVPARVCMSEAMVPAVTSDSALQQLINTASLPGVVKAVIAMPDIHQGYGFPIGGVAATDAEHGGVISPGGIGYDINCGVRLIRASMHVEAIMPYIEPLATGLSRTIPSGIGHGGDIIITEESLDHVMRRGAHYMLELGYGTHNDCSFCEEHGCMPEADPQAVSVLAKKRGLDQLGTLGSGNHFLEVQRVVDIYDQQAANAYGLQRDHITIMIHCGSRGLGHQICTDYVRLMLDAMPSFGIAVPDRELACAPLNSSLGKQYYGAMAAAANFAWANRHCIGHGVRRTFSGIVGSQVELATVYDVSHNIGKFEKHVIDGSLHDLFVHRKGATRAFGPSRTEIPSQYRSVGQPVLIPGTMGTSSYVLAAQDKALDVSFGSSCHGAGRQMSRAKAKTLETGAAVRKRLENMGIVVRCPTNAGLAEEAPGAYKDIDDVVQVVEQVGLARRVARMVPIAVIKGS